MHYVYIIFNTTCNVLAIKVVIYMVTIFKFKHIVHVEPSLFTIYRNANKAKVKFKIYVVCMFYNIFVLNINFGESNLFLCVHLRSFWLVDCL